MSEQWLTKTFDELTLDELYALLQLRQDVFIIEQDSIYRDLDDLDQDALHILLKSGGKLVAYQRCLAPGVKYTESSLGRVIVSDAMRGRQLGRELVQRGIDLIRERWPGHEICISAQAHLQDFYGSLGFVGEGDKYDEDGIPHRQMRLAAG